MGSTPTPSTNNPLLLLRKSEELTTINLLQMKQKVYDQLTPFVSFVVS